MKIRLLPCLLALVLLGGGLWLLLGKNRGHVGEPPDGPAIPLSVSEIARLRNRGLALVENQKPREAIPLLQSLLDEAPGHAAFAQQNLLVSIALALELENAEANPSAFEDLFQLADATLSRERAEGIDPGAIAILQGRIARARGKPIQRLEAALQATTSSAHAPSAWYEYYLAWKESPADVAATAPLSGLQALARCYEQTPDNTWGSTEYLMELAQARQPHIIEVLEHLQTVMAPYASAIQQRSRVDFHSAVEEAIAAARDANWSLVTRQARLIGNILKPEDIAQSDRAQLFLNTLEYVSTAAPPDFQSELHSVSTMGGATRISFATRDIGLPDSASPLLQCDACDMNLDGRQELIVLTASQLWILQQRESGWEALFSFPLADTYTRFLLADLDQDADPAAPGPSAEIPCAMADLDLVLYGPAGAITLENRLRHEGTCVPHTLEIVLPATYMLPADFDLDGDLDLVALGESGEIQMLANHQNFTFYDLSDRSRLPEPVPWLKAIAVDLDRDVDLDILLLARDRVGYLENLRHGELRWRELDVIPSASGDYTDMALVDLNADARWDLLIGRGGEIYSVLGRSTLPGRLEFHAGTLLSCAGEEFLLCDHDNSGWQDLVIRNSGTQSLTLAPRIAAVDFSSEQSPLRIKEQGTGMLVEDLDMDGDLDLLVWSPTRLSWYENEGGNTNGYLKLTLLGQQVKGEQASASGRVNQYGWGSLLELKAGTVYQSHVASRPTTHFGLGTLDRADVLRVVWPNGIPQNILAPPRNSVICEELKLKGSCPYLYTWNGTEFVFCTDLLWAAPLGLQFAEGVLAPTRPWEYLLIEGERLLPREQGYSLQITEELWEAAYFDQVELIAIDHPREIAVYSDEKVASSKIPEFKIHTVRQPLPVRSASDSHGRDVLPQIAARDENYTRLFDTKFYQGVTNEHFLELDLGEIDNSRPIKLFLAGWVYPSDTSLNVALGQNAAAPKGRPPFLQALDDSGNWVTVDPSMGFPGGKTKTIVVDLAGKFPGKSSKLRIVTSMELYWDHVFYTLGEDEAPITGLRVESLELTSADLHYRGYSNILPHPGNGPDHYDYAHVDPAPGWPAMQGRFTPYGGVLELLKREDDRLVVLGAGDELTLTFKQPDRDPPAGWKRDFFLRSVGYDKDADLNTIYGRSSEPYPTRKNPINPTLEQDHSSKSPTDFILPPSADRHQPARHFWNAVRDYSPGTDARSD